MKWTQLFSYPVVILAALGYFVDIYDLTLFSIVRSSSLKSLGYQGDEVLKVGIFLFNVQLVGMLIGGFLWGVLADKRGRLSVLLASILTYSIANIGNAFVVGIYDYTFWRFIAGIGLAGELGVGITIVSEALPKELRGLGTTIVAATGLCGGICAAMVADLYSWKIAYFVGGVAGLILLALRLKVLEPGVFHSAKASGAQLGNFLQILKSKSLLAKYLSCAVLGIPMWYVVGILIALSPEFGVAKGISGTIVSGTAVIWNSVGLVVGDVFCGLFSQKLKSRKKAVGVFIALLFLFLLAFIFVPSTQPIVFYAICGLLGFAGGYWAMFVTIAAENFGTNLRATVATTLPNLVRGSTIALSLLFLAMKEPFGVLPSAAGIGFFVIALAAYGLWKTEETFSKDLDYVESGSTGSVALGSLQKLNQGDLEANKAESKQNVA